MDIRILKQRLNSHVYGSLLELQATAKEKMVALPTVRLRKLAAILAHKPLMTKSERLDMIKKVSRTDCGGKSKAATLESLNDAARAIVLVIQRYDAVRNSVNYRSAKSVGSRIPRGTPAIRHESRVKAAAIKCYESAIRMSVNNKATIIATNSTTPAVLVEDYYTRGYKGMHRHRQMHCFETYISLPPLWYSRVYQRNIACLEEYFVVDVRVLYTTTKGVCVLEAVAAKNGKGCQVNMQNIHIAITKTGGVFYEDNPALFVELPRFAANTERRMLSTTTRNVK